MKRKFRFSTLLLLGGCLMICGDFLHAYSNLAEERRAGVAASEAVTALASLREKKAEPDPKPEVKPPDTTVSSFPEVEIPHYILNPDMPMPEMEIDGKRYIGTLEIPSINLNLPVITNYAVDKDLKSAPCRYSGSVYTDNAVICGHNYKTHFGSLGRLQKGDTVIFTDNDGNEFRYRVSFLETLDGYDIEGMLQDGDWDLTLFTCTLGGKSRVTARCERISGDAL